MPFRSRRARSWFFTTKQPHNVTFLIALLLGVLGIVGTHARIDFVSPNAFWFEVAAWVLLSLGCLITGL